MEIRVLKYFLAVVREGGINRAAEALHITQPTLSRQLSQLERLLLSYVLGIVFGMGVIGIAAAMVVDWMIRAVIFCLRQKSGKWKEFQVI